MSSSSNPLFPRIDKYRRALTAGNNRTANDSQGPSSEDLEMKRYRELRASNAFHVGTDFYSPRLAEADKMGVRVLIEQKLMSHMVDLTPIFQSRLNDNPAGSASKPRVRSKSLTVDALIEYSPVQLHRRTKRSVSNVGAFFNYKESLGPAVRFSRNYDDGFDDTEELTKKHRLPPIVHVSSHSLADEVQAANEADYVLIPESRPHYPSLMDLQNSASCVSNTVSTKGDNRVLMSKRFLKKSNTSYTAPKPRDLVFSQSTTPKSAIKQPRRHKRLPIDTVITANINEKYSKERIKSREEEEEEEESQETVRKIRQRLREKVVYELQKDFSKRNIKLSNEDIQALWLKLAEVLDEEFTEDYNIWPMSEAIFPSRTSIKIAVMNGRISTHSAEYNQLIEECKPLGIRNSVSQFLPQIERLCQEYALQWAEIDSFNLERTMLIHDQNTFTSSMTAHALLDCCVNREQIQSFMDFPGQKYKGIGSLERAATKIQATWLTYCARAHFKKIEPRLQALGLFFKRWTSHKRRALMRGSIKVLEDFHVKRAEVLMTILASEWETIKQSERVIVHIPSYETAKGIHEDFQHYIRACDIKDKNVHVIIVLSQPLDENYVETMRNTLLRGIDLDRFNRGISIVTPTCAHLFQKGANLVEMLLVSHNTLCEIKDLIAGRFAYIVAGRNQFKNYVLSSILELPLISATPKAIKRLVSSDILTELQEMLYRDSPPTLNIPWDPTKVEICLYFHYYIDPSGAVSDLGPSELIKVGDDTSFDLIPAHYFPVSFLTGIVVDLATKCFENGVTGFLSLKFIRRDNTIVVAEVLPFYNERILKMQQFLTATNTRYDGDGNYLFNAQQAQIPDFSFLTMVKDVVNISEASRKTIEARQMENRVGIWCDNCHHSNLSTMPAHVFNILAQSMDIDFDEQMRSGNLLINSKTAYAANDMAFMSIQANYSKALSQAINVLTVFKRILHIYGMECNSNLDSMMKKMDYVLSNIEGSKGANEGAKATAKLKVIQTPQGKRGEGGDVPAEEEHPNRPIVQFINPSADLFENPFRKTMDEVEGKIKFVKHFIATDVLYQVMTNVNAHIKVVETRRYNEWVEQKLAALTRTETTPELRLDMERKPEDQPRSATVTISGNNNNNSRTAHGPTTATPSRKNQPSTGPGSAKVKKERKTPK